MGKCAVYHKIILVIIGIIMLPVAMAIINGTILTIFNLGTYVGTFIRYIMNSVIC